MKITTSLGDRAKSRGRCHLPCHSPCCFHTGSKSLDYVFVNETLLQGTVGASFIYFLTLSQLANTSTYPRSHSVRTGRDLRSSSLRPAVRRGNDLSQISGWRRAAGPVLTPKWNSCLTCLLDTCSTTKQTSLCHQLFLYLTHGFM